MLLLIVNVNAMTRYIFLVALISSLSACGGKFPNPFEGLGKKTTPEEVPIEEPLSAIDVPADVPAEPETQVATVGTAGQSADTLDTTTKAEKAAASVAPVDAKVLGTTVASLGDPTEQGFWLRTPLVSAQTEGAVETEGGAVVQVKLIPIDGPASAGSRISLSAMRALNLGLTDLATLIVSKT